MDNRTHERSTWDSSLLITEVMSLEETDYTASFMDFDYLFPSDEEPKEKKYDSKELDENDFKDFDHQCPKCGFEFNAT
jgi:hypothetical protein